MTAGPGDEAPRLKPIRQTLRGRFKPRDALVISGSPRSGTTWVTELILQALPDTAVVFEPLHPEYVPKAPAVGPDGLAFVPVGGEWPEGEQFLREALSGRIINQWTARYLDLELARSSQRVLVKFVRAQRMIGWIATRIPIRPPLIVMRHPCAVFTSRVRTGWFGDPGRPIVEDVVAHHPGLGPILGRLSTPEEFAAASWALDSFLALVEADTTSYQVVAYEELVADPRPGLQRILQGWDLAANRVTHVDPGRPSSTTVEAGVAGLNGWQRELGPDQIRRMLAVTAAFGLDFYGDDPRPDHSRLFRADLPATLRSIGAGG